MRLKSKALIFYSFFIIGLILVFTFGELYFTKFSFLAAFIWFIFFGIAQFIILRCPYCKRLAIKTESGLYVPWTGKNCRYCGKEY